MSSGVGHRCGSDLVALWLWYRLVATAPVGTLVWEPPYAIGTALKRREKKKQSKIKQKQENNKCSQDCREIGTLCTVGENVNWCGYYGKQYGSSSSNNIELSYDSAVPFLGISQKN